MGLQGDFAKLKKLQVQLAALANEETRRRLSTVVGAEAITQVKLGFRESRNPYGLPWAPPVLRAGKPLLDSGRLRNSFTYKAETSGFRIGTNVVYSAVHQYGATITARKSKYLKFKSGRRGGWVQRRSVKIPARQMVPEGRLGPIWQKAFDAAAKRFFSRILKP